MDKCPMDFLNKLILTDKNNLIIWAYKQISYDFSINLQNHYDLC